MATYTSNYGWTKPSGSDNVDISVLNNNLDGQDGVIHDAFLNMAPPFSESSTYAVDDIVLYGTGLYKCHTAVVTPGSWTGSTNWQVYKLSEGGSGGGTSNYNDLSNKPSINGVTLSGNKTTSDLGINADNVMMSDGVTSVEDALDDMQAFETLTKNDLIDESTKNAAITLTKFSIEKIKGLPIGRLIIDFSSTANISGSGANLGTLKSDVFAGIRPIANCTNTSDGTPGGTIFVNSHSSGYPVIVYVITANKTYHVDLFVLLNS